MLGLKKYGKGDWRNISRNYVTTRTPTQVASHAQKYYIRQLSGGKDKRRSSIHDITTVNLVDSKSPLLDNNKPPSPDHSTAVLQQQTQLQQHSNMSGMVKALYDWGGPNQGSTMAFDLLNSSLMTLSPRGTTPSYGMKMQEHNLQRGNLHGLEYGPYNTIFQMQFTQPR